MSGSISDVKYIFWQTLSDVNPLKELVPQLQAIHCKTKVLIPSFLMDGIHWVSRPSRWSGLWLFWQIMNHKTIQRCMTYPVLGGCNSTELLAGWPYSHINRFRYDLLGRSLTGWTAGGELSGLHPLVLEYIFDGFENLNLRRLLQILLIFSVVGVVLLRLCVLWLSGGMDWSLLWGGL